jgi:hypothetical protein
MEPSFELEKRKTLASVREADETPITLKITSAKKGVQFEWDENKRKDVSGWCLYVGTKADNGGYQWGVFNSIQCPEKHVIIPYDHVPRTRIYAQVEGTLSGGATILSEVESWSRILSAKGTRGPASMVLKPRSMPQH